MKKKLEINEQSICRFEKKMRQEEREPSTIEMYLRIVRNFGVWADGRVINKETVLEWKSALTEQGYCPSTVNSMLAAVNKFFACMGFDKYKVRYLRLQRRVFSHPGRELTRQEYCTLVDTAYRTGNERLGLLMETICATGIRVSEVKYITVEAVRKGMAEVALKGKIRTILLSHKLCRKLMKYVGKQKIASGEIFITRSGKGLSRKFIWAEMKRLGRQAGIAGSKLFPHNLRHLFARTFYQVSRDVVKLANVLGHTSIETTRIYLMTTGKEYARQLNRLGLVL